MPQLLQENSYSTAELERMSKDDLPLYPALFSVDCFQLQRAPKNIKTTHPWL